MDQTEAQFLASLAKVCQGLPISLAPNKPFKLMLSDLLWVDPEKDPLTKNDAFHSTSTDTQEHLAVTFLDAEREESAPSYKEYQEFSLLPPFVPSTPIEIISPPTLLHPILLEKEPLTKDLSFTKLENDIAPTTSPNVKKIESTLTSPPSPSPSPSLSPTVFKQTLHSPASMPVPEQSPLLEPSFSVPASVNTAGAIIDPRLPPRCHSSHLNASKTVGQLGFSGAVLENVSTLPSITSSGLTKPTKESISSINPAKDSSKTVSSPNIHHIYSVYRTDSALLTNTSSSAEHSGKYSKLTKEEHAKYLTLEKKKKEFSLSHNEKCIFEKLQCRVEKEQKEYANYVKSYLFDASARYLAINELVEKTLTVFLRQEQKRRSLYHPLYVSKHAWKPFTVFKEDRNIEPFFQRIKVHLEMLHVPMKLDVFKTINLPFDFRPDLTKILPPLSKDSVMAQLIPSLPDVQIMMTSGTLSKLVQIAHDFKTEGSTKSEVMFPVTIHQGVACIDKPLLNANCLPRQLMQKYFVLTLRALGRQHAPPSFQFASYKFGAFTLLVRTQLDGPEQRIKCNVEYVAELGLEELEPSLLAGYAMKEKLGQRVKVARVHLTSGKVLDVAPENPVTLSPTFLVEVFQYLRTLPDGFYVLATRPSDEYVYVLEQLHQGSARDTANLDIRPAHVQITLTPSIRMLKWRTQPGHIPNTFPFPPIPPPPRPKPLPPSSLQSQQQQPLKSGPAGMKKQARGGTVHGFKKRPFQQHRHHKPTHHADALPSSSSSFPPTSVCENEPRKWTPRKGFKKRGIHDARGKPMRGRTKGNAA